MKDNSFHIYELLENQQLLNESYEVEFKSAKGGLPGSLWETYSAFANSEGGTIVLGATEKGEEIFYDGLPLPQMRKYQDDFWNLANNKGKISVNLLSESQVKLINTDKDLYLLAINVPSADYKSKPVYIGQDPQRGTYKRNYVGDYHCTAEEVRQMIADALPQKPDARILQNFSLDDLDGTSLSQYRQLFSNTKPGHPYLSEDDKGLLLKVGGWRIDRHSKTEGLTLAGLLMFGKYRSIIDFLPDFHVDYQEIMENEKRWSDRIFPDGTWEANLFQFYRRVWPKISSSLPKPFHLHDGQRKDEDALHEALREALVNALVHADYSVSGGIVIKKYLDYFELSNPGNLLITMEQYYRGGISIPRNNSIQTMFVLLGYGEKAGSGSSRIISAWDGQHWRKPYINTLSSPSRIELFLRMESLLPQKSVEFLVKKFGEGVRHLYGNGLIALTTAEIEGSISNVRLQQLVNIHSSEISKLLKELCLNGYLHASGKGRGTVYQLIPDHKSGKQGSLFDVPGANLDTFGTNHDTLGANHDTLGANLDTSTFVSTSKIPKKLKRSDLEELILNHCAEEYYSVERISKIVNRKASYIQNEILPSLINQGRLERLYRDTPNHPNQAYKSAK